MPDDKELQPEVDPDDITGDDRTPITDPDEIDALWNDS